MVFLAGDRLTGVSYIAGPFGVWTDVTPVGMDLNVASNGGDNYAVSDVIADPVTAGTFYCFVCYQGVWRSTNFGLTWAKVSSGGGNMDAGKNWGADIAADGSYMLSTQSLRFAMMRSTDRGVTWSVGANLSHEPYMVAISPFDSTRALITFHDSGYNHLYESIDSGLSWSDVGVVNASVTQSHYVHYLHNSDTVLVVPEGAGQGVYRGAKSGGTWSFSAISDLANTAHAHGSHQIFCDVANGAFYYPGADNGGDTGIWKSTNNGANWTRVYSGSVENAVIGTSSTLYAMYAFPIGSGTIDPKVTTAARSPGTSWGAATSPSGMVNGAKRLAVGTDGMRSVVLAGCWHGGIWRYVEAA